MQTVIGIVICLIVGIYFLIGIMNNNENGFMNIYEGLTTNATSAATNATSATTTIPTGVPLTTALANSANALKTIKTIVPAINNSENKSMYIEHIDNLLDYCDYSILNLINNATLDAATSTYNVKELDEIVRFAKIKDALTGSTTFLDLA